MCMIGCAGTTVAARVSNGIRNGGCEVLPPRSRARVQPVLDDILVGVDQWMCRPASRVNGAAPPPSLR
eukprot:15450782-Alexandrium_andersonii.AAC.1